MRPTGTANLGTVTADEFSALTQPAMASLTRFAATLGPSGSAEDVVQEALLRAWSKRDISIDPRRAIGELPAAQRTTIILYYYVDLSIEDTASVLHRSPGTVKSALHDARRKLAARLGVDYV